MKLVVMLIVVVVVVVVLVNVVKKIRDKAGSRERARARHIQYNHYLQTALICDRNGEIMGRRRDDVELSPRRTSDGPAWRGKDISGNGVRKRQADFSRTVRVSLVLS